VKKSAPLPPKKPASNYNVKKRQKHTQKPALQKRPE
jgi:hypothetical protein